MSVPGPGETYDVIVIGAGPIGQTVADRARAAGLTVAVVERELVGGECSYWACVPSKAMLRPVTALADARRVGGAREAVTGLADAPATFARRDWWVTNWNDEGQANFLRGRRRPGPRPRPPGRGAAGHGGDPGWLDGHPGRQARGGGLHRQRPGIPRARRPGRSPALVQPGSHRRP